MVQSNAIGEWDLETGRMLRETPLETNVSAHAARFSSDGRMLAGRNREREIMVWDVATGEALFTGKTGGKDIA
jgi:hypothetical protein